jgi:predicted HicB family RNase H-like nuclease
VSDSRRHYTYRVEWSPEDGEWVGLCVEFPSLSWLDLDPVEAVRGIDRLVSDVVKDMYAEGENVPQPLAERHYSGKVMVRTSPELHKRLTIEAAERHLSLNQWAIHKLAERAASA